MYLTTLFSAILLINRVLCVEEITFRNVTVFYYFHEQSDPRYNFLVESYSKTIFISASKTLREKLPEKKITFVNFEKGGTIPVLRKNSIENLQFLYDVSLNDQGIEEIEVGAFGNLPNLEDLYLTSNKLSEIKDGIFNLPNLTRLHLGFNVIDKISPNAFDGLPKLEFLSLMYNKLSKFYLEWFEKKVMVCVDLSYNFIEEIPEGSFENIDSGMENPKFGYCGINLHRNKIKKISNSMFGNKTEMRYLDVSDNEITTWDENLFENVTVEVFKISGNKIECLEGNLTKLLGARENFIHENPWDCDCASRIFEWYWNNPKMVRIEELPNYSCKIRN